MLWTTMLITMLCLSLIFLAIGIMLYFSKFNINYLLGYRSTRSMKNEETWRYANKLFAKLSIVYSIILLIITAITMPILYGKAEKLIEIVTLLGYFLPMGLGLIILMVIVEIKLKKKFG